MAQGSPVALTSAQVERVSTALKWFSRAANVTGVLLLLLAVEIIAKYGFGSELEMLGPQGVLAFVPNDTVQAINLSSAILIAHGWFYVVYLFTCFRVWSLLRWPFWRFLWLASGGLFPVFSFFLERWAHRVVEGIIAAAGGDS
jgi:integral membrane protein